MIFVARHPRALLLGHVVDSSPATRRQRPCKGRSVRRHRGHLNAPSPARLPRRRLIFNNINRDIEEMKFRKNHASSSSTTSTGTTSTSPSMRIAVNTGLHQLRTWSSSPTISTNNFAAVPHRRHRIAHGLRQRQRVLLRLRSANALLTRF